ncbi:MAG: AraC family transcriptional regulator [Xanthobacteraceae bacterium]
MTTPSGTGAVTSEVCPEPLQRFPIFQTSDSAQFRDAIVNRFGAVRAEVDANSLFRARGNLVQLKDIALIHGASTTSVSIEYPETNLYRFLIALAGYGEAIVDRKATTVSKCQSVLSSPGHRTRITGNGNHGWLTLRLNPGAVDRKLTAILGYKPRGKLRFESAADNSRPEVELLRQLIAFLARQLDSNAVVLPPPVLESLEQAIIVALLGANRHTYSDILQQDAPRASPRAVRLAEQYIEANWNKPIRLEDLTALTDTSSRSLFRTFKSHRGLTPMAFAKNVRLKHARDILADGTSSTTVTGVALKCGFGNLGHFARDYREAFGELPSDTLTRTHQGR